MNNSIRKAAPDDAPFIALLGRITFREAFGHVFPIEAELLEYFEKTFSVAKIRSSLEKENNVFWLAFADGLPVGYAKMKKYSPNADLPYPTGDMAQLQKIYVLRDFLSLRIGEQLQTAVFEETQRLGKHALWLAVWTGNDRALRFYQKHDYIQEAALRHSIGSQTFDFEVMVRHF